MSEETIDKIFKAALADPMKTAEYVVVEALHRARKDLNCKEQGGQIISGCGVSKFQDGESGGILVLKDSLGDLPEAILIDRGFKKHNYPPWCVTSEK
jgi:hypothetical protein